MKKYNNLLQQDVDILFQSQRELYSKVEILNQDFKILQSIEGLLISDSFTNDATSDIRRTYSSTIFVKNQSYFIDGRYQLINKYIRPYIGIRYIRTGEIIWYLQGTYCINNGSFNYNETTHEMSLSCEDLMSTLNGNRGGKIVDQKIVIPAETKLRTAIIQILDEANISNYLINDIDELSIPYDLEYTDNTYYNILKELIELYAGYEMYFDVYGKFIVQKIPNGSNDENIIDDDIIQPLLISDNGSFNFSGIYNHIIIYGRQIETDRNLVNCTFNNNIYTATNSNLTEYENLTTYSANVPSASLDGSKLALNSLQAKNIVKDDGILIEANDIGVGVYSFRYRKASDDFLLLGQYQVKGEAFNHNPDSPFSIENVGYEITNVLQGSDYEKIYTDKLANHRASYEIYQAGNMNDNVVLEILSIPWLDVNSKIEYTSANTNQTYSYIVKSITGSMSESTMTVTMIRFYEDFSEII